MASIIHKGIEWRRTFTTIDDDTGLASDLSALTGADITVELRRRSTEPNIQAYTLGDGLTLTGDGSTGVFTIELPAEDSTPLETANHVYRVLIENQVALDWMKVMVRD